MTGKPTEHRFVLCIRNDDDDSDDLERRKVYQVIPDEESEKEGYIRVIDESGEDYLYPEPYFVRVQLPEEAEKTIVIAR